MPADRETHPTSTQPTVLITAGPTHEPIDAVRYIANRSSGTLGLALAEAARDRGLPIRLLLGPSNARTDSLLKNEREGNSAQTERNTASQVAVARFQTAAELGVLLREHAPKAGILIMAAAVADYRPGHTHSGKLPRTGSGMTVELEPVPDLLAATVPILAPSAIAVGFALEEDMSGDDRAASKMARKGCHAIVLNPLSTMDSGKIDARILFADQRPPISSGPLPKAEFAARLIDVAVALWHQRQLEGPEP